VPLIAAAHHEKLDGSGYPLGLAGDEIPLPSRVMTVCDIYDALTAMDRPYKPALEPSAALALLDEEVAGGMLDADVLKVFVESGVYRVLAPLRRRATG
jgi:HD-GYP domain-containing protein (c-di-GMP phosphodiesterase class II)